MSYPMIAGYYAQIQVLDAGAPKILEVVVSDFDFPENVLKQLGERYGVGTVGEVVERAVEDGAVLRDGGCGCFDYGLQLDEIVGVEL